MADVGLPADRLDVPMRGAVGRPGRPRRARGAAAGPADLLLLDEPTNDLDLPGLALLERIVRRAIPARS